jgi:hypothetical protein
MANNSLDFEQFLEKTPPPSPHPDRILGHSMRSETFSFLEK